jgi:murein DD-endopeptidase MepM/ murein hydrolase activator NlpD
MTSRSVPRDAWTSFVVPLVSAVLCGALVPAPAAATQSVTPDRRVPASALDVRSDRLAIGVAEAEAAYRAAHARVRKLSERSARLSTAAHEAEAHAKRLHLEVRDEEGGGLRSALSEFLRRGDSPLSRAVAAAAAAQHTRTSAESAEAAVADAIMQTERARLAWDRAMNRAAQRTARQTARLAARTAARQSQFRRSYQAADDAQEALNRKALRRWLRYLDALADAAVVPPSATDLKDPERLPDGLDPLRDQRGRVVPGVAEVDPAGVPPAVVLSAETIRAVAAVFSRVGVPPAESVGAVAYACGGLVADAWGMASTTVPAASLAQWRELRAVPTRQMQVGDVVLTGSKKAGLTGSGIYVGDRMMIAADEQSGRAAVRRMRLSEVYAVRRATLPNRAPVTAPEPDKCGKVEKAPRGTGAALAPTAPFVFPMVEGSYASSAGFGQGGALWSSGRHSGHDFAAPLGTAVYSAASGTVTVEDSAWAGRLARIDHGGGVETWYAHMSKVVVDDGQEVQAGEVIGKVGSEGNSTGPHLHFEVRLDGAPVDPMSVLLPLFAEGTVANGEIPESSLCTATFLGDQLLRCDAAVGLRMMSAAYESAMGEPLCMTDSYRSRAGQEALFVVKPGLAATPGTSNHGWGVAVDLCGGVERFGTPQHEWLVANGPAFGWQHPPWAAADGSRPEAWHFEFGAA